MENIVAAIQTFVSERENRNTEVVEVAPEKHGSLIGRGGDVKRALESEFHVSIDIPRSTEQGPARSQIRITGQPEDVTRATAHIQGLVKDQGSETIQVPCRLHHNISDNGRFFQRLNHEYQVTVNHDGHQPPTKRAATPKPGTNGTALPLITDEPDASNGHTWDIVDEDKNDVEQGDIPWVLHGSPEKVARARSAVQKAIHQAESQDVENSATGYLVLPDPRSHRFVIGSKGSQIDAIRRQTGCQIHVPKDQTKGKAIEITGSRDGVEQAKDIILDVVENGGKSRRRES